MKYKKTNPLIRLLFFIGILACSLPGAVVSAQESGETDILRDLLWDKLIGLKPPARPGVGLALSGGGARGFAHAGVLEALEYAAFPVDYISGTSMGAVVGGLYASGMSVARINDFAAHAAELKISRDFKGIKLIHLLLTDKLITPTYINRFIENNLGSLSFEQLKIPFSCVAMDFKTGEKIVFNEGPLSIAVRSSVNLPGIFAPVEYKHRYLVDGGVVAFIPIDTAKMLGAQWVLASVAGGVSKALPENVLTSLLQVIDIRGSILAASEEKNADFVVKTNVGDITMSDFEECSLAGEAGVIETSRRLDAAKKTYLIFAAPQLMEAL